MSSWKFSKSLRAHRFCSLKSTRSGMMENYSLAQGLRLEDEGRHSSKISCPNSYVRLRQQGRNGLNQAADKS